MKRKNLKIIPLLALVTMLASCGEKTSDTTKPNTESSNNTSETGKKTTYDNTVYGIVDFLNDAAKADNYTVSYYYEDEEACFKYDSYYVYGSLIDGGYIVIDDFFSQGEGALFSFSNNDEEKSIDLGTIYALQSGTKVYYPGTTLTVNPLKYYTASDGIGGEIVDSLLTEENGKIISTDKSFNYYLAALSGYQSYIEDGDSPAISLKYQNNTLVCNLMVYDEDNTTLVDYQGADFVISDVGTTTFANGENFLKYSSADFAASPAFANKNCPDLLSDKWSLDITRSVINKDNSMTVSTTVKYDFDNQTDKKGVSWKQYNKDDVLLYTLCYQVDDKGLYSSSLNNMNELIKEYYDGENITAFQDFKNYFTPELWKKDSEDTYKYYGLDAATILYDLTMWKMDTVQVMDLTAHTEKTDGVDIIKSFSAVLYTPTYSMSGTTVDEKYEYLEVEVQTPAREIDTSLAEKLPENVPGVTDRLKTAIDSFNDTNKDYKVTTVQFDTLNNVTYMTKEETFMKDYYLNKTVKNNSTDYRGMKMVGDQVVYFKVVNGEVKATSSLSNHDTALNQRKEWNCSPAVYEKEEGTANTFHPNGNVKLIPDNMPLEASDTPSNIKITLKDSGTHQDYLDKITYRVSTMAGYIVDDYTLTYDWGDDGDVAIDSAIASKVEALQPLSEDELPKTWLEDLSGVDKVLKSNGFTDNQIAALPYIYSPALSGNYKCYNLGGINVCSSGDVNQSKAVRQQFQSDYLALLTSEEMVNAGWVRSAGNDDIPLFKNQNLEITLLVGSEADYGLTIYPYIVD